MEERQRGDYGKISPYEPFHGAIKKSFGFQVILKVVSGHAVIPAEPRIIAQPKEMATKQDQ